MNESSRPTPSNPPAEEPDGDPRRRFSKEGILEFAAQFPFFNLIGLEILDMEPGWSLTRLEHRPDLTQPAGILHGGVMASLVDTGIAHALLLTDRFRELRAENGALVSVDLRVRFFRPVAEGSVICESKVTRLGRKVIHAEAVVRREGADDQGDGPNGGSAEGGRRGGKEVARGDAIYMAVPGKQIERD